MCRKPSPVVFYAVIGLALIATLLVRAADLPSAVTLAPIDPLSKGGTFSVRIPNGPASASKATVMLIRDGKQTPAENVTVDAKTSPGTVEVTAKAPDDIAFGDYVVRVQLEGARSPNFAKLHVRPPGITEITLDKFAPEFTHEADTLPRIGKPAAPVHLTLRGRGFVQPTHADPSDLTIWINNARPPIVWDGCPRSSDAADDHQIHGKVVSTEQVELCDVPVPESGKLLVRAAYGDTPGDPQAFTVYRMNKIQVAFISLLITIALALLVLLLIFGIKSYVIVDRFRKEHTYRVRKLFLDPETNTYSLSKFQFYMWTAAALFAYGYLYISKVMVQHLPWPDIPASLPGIVSIGAGTAIGSQVVTNTMGAKGAGEELPSPSDFLTSGGVAAPDRIQMFLWTIFGVGAFCMGVLQDTPGGIKEIAPVPEGMLYMMGLSAAGYLGGKLARKAGPVISEIFVNPPDPDDVIAQSTIVAGAELPELAQVVVPASTALAVIPAVTNAGAKMAVDSLRAAVQATTSAHTVNELSALIVTLAKLRADAERGAEQAAADFSKDASLRQDAQTAQNAASVLQDLAADVTSAISQAAMPVMEASVGTHATARTIEIRGTGLSPEATFDIDHTELPFRMLTNSQGQNAPEVVSRQDGGTFARLLRLSIDPSQLAGTDLAQFETWFGTNTTTLFTITNPDGQKAELSFSLPPAAAQKSGESGQKAEPGKKQ